MTDHQFDMRGFVIGIAIGLILMFLIRSFMGTDYLCCDLYGGGHQCWSDKEAGLFTPAFSQQTRDALSKECRLYPHHVYFDFQE